MIRTWRPHVRQELTISQWNNMGLPLGASRSTARLYLWCLLDSCQMSGEGYNLWYYLGNRKALDNLTRYRKNWNCPRFLFSKWSLFPIPHACLLRFIDLPLQPENAIHQGLSSRRTARNVNIDGYDTVAPTHNAIAIVIITSSVRTTPHANNPARIRHLIVNLPQGWCHLIR